MVGSSPIFHAAAIFLFDMINLASVNRAGRVYDRFTFGDLCIRERSTGLLWGSTSPSSWGLAGR